MLSKFNASLKLYLLVFVMSACIVGMGVYGINNLKTMNHNTQTLYADRVLCLQQLTAVRYAYATGIMSSAQQVKNHQLTYKDAGKQVEEAVQQINVNWTAYMHTYLTPEEAKLAKQNETLMGQAGETIEKLQGILNKEDGDALDHIINKELYAAINPVISQLNELVKLQIRVSAELYKNSNEVYNSTAKKFYALIAASILLAFVLSFFIIGDTWSLIKSLEASNRKIAESEAKCRAFIKYAGDSIFILDTSLRITDANDSTVKLTGYQRKELLQMKISDIISQDELPLVNKALDAIEKEGGSLHERKFKRKDGSIIETEVNVRIVEGVGFISIVRDITERKKAALVLREREALLTAIFDNMEGATSLLDEEKRYVLFNSRFIHDNRVLTNQDPYIGQQVYDGFPDTIRNERLKMLDNVLKGNKEVIEIDHVRDGKRVYYRTSFSPVITDGKITGISTYSIDLTKSKEAEEKIRQSEIKYRNIFENVMDVVFQTTLDGTILDVSPSAETLVGLTRQQLIGTRVDLLYYDQADREKGESLPRVLRESGETKDFELRFKSAIGEPIYISVNARLIRKAGSGAMHIDGMFRNVTESKKAEEEIKRLNRLYQFISRINESMLKLDSKEEIFAAACNIAVEVGKFQMAWIGTYDEQRDKIVPTTWSGFEDGFFKSIGDSIFKVSTSSIPSARAIRSKSYFYYNDVEHDTSIPDAVKKEMLKRNYRSAVSFPVFIDSKIVAAFVLLMSEPFFFTEEEVKLVKDVTDNITYALDKIGIRDLRKKEEEKHRALTENIGDAILLINGNSEIIYQTPSVERISGFALDKTNGGRVEEYIHPGDLDSFHGFFKEVIDSPGVPMQSQYRVLHKEGHYLWVEGTITNLLHNESVNAFVVIYRDITARKNAEEEIVALNESLEQKVIDRTTQLQEANKALEAFSYSVSHDLRAPLRAIIGFTKIIEKEYGPGFNADLSELFRHIGNSSKRMSAIIDDMLTLAKYDKAKLRPATVDMEKLVNSVWANLLSQTSHHATLQLSELPETEADISMIEQVVVNLLSNAVKYSSKKEHPVVSVGYERNDDAVTFFVKDNGAGFDMKNYDRLFGAFQRLHGMSEFEGTGVGLTLVKRIVEKHGGIVWAEGKVNEGATFYFTLPVVQFVG